MGWYNRREAIAEAERVNIRRDLAGHGHDPQAALRMGRLVSLQDGVAGLLATSPPALHQEIRQAAEKQAAGIRAEGPVGCECGHWRCVESQPQALTQ